ncbi:protein translocase subunit SecF [Patescibacteria group bacterium]|nr:protein translocase subunit SecF [Patescibacteria group bacterium]MBU1472254.1 protein translocase subunit SecF [Patescibacteria group bacterium]MBU2460495.1 protein translocase subunit SecF [Patescibacteria group bacterium]MBU2544030.1 protein translocase subunit SecF [Patescibacteria group bacterium]
MIRFSKYIWLYVIISGIVLIPGSYSLIRFGLVPAIDFTGGTLLEVAFDKKVDPVVFTSSADDVGIELSSVQRSGANSYLLRMKPETDDRLALLESHIASGAASPSQVLRTETVGPTLGRELLTKAIMAAMLAIGAILAYVAYAFKNVKFGLAAVVALLHDLLVVVGTFSLFGRLWHVEVDTLFVTAVLTTMSFSVHDTIVVFDRIREYMKRSRGLSLEEVTDRALTETMNRSLVNSLTIVFMLLALVLMGGVTIKWFVVALLIGTVSGTYSSPFIATPVLLFLDRWEKRRKR